MWTPQEIPRLDVRLVCVDTKGRLDGLGCDDKLLGFYYKKARLGVG